MTLGLRRARVCWFLPRRSVSIPHQSLSPRTGQPHDNPVTYFLSVRSILFAQLKNLNLLIFSPFQTLFANTQVGFSNPPLQSPRHQVNSFPCHTSEKRGGWGDYG